MNPSLNEQQRENYINEMMRYRGRIFAIRHNIICNLEKNTQVYVKGYDADQNIFTCQLPDSGNKVYCLPEELNVIDREFKSPLIKKGIRNERVDKYKNEYAIELIKDQKSIQFSASLLSLLLCNTEKSYIGFAFDPDLNEFYIFKSDENQGYEIDQKNSRIKSSADWRELYNYTGKTIIGIYDTPIINSEFPDTIFYKINSSFKSNNVTSVKAKSYIPPKYNPYESQPSLTSKGLIEAMEHITFGTSFSSNTVTEAKPKTKAEIAKEVLMDMQQENAKQDFYTNDNGYFAKYINGTDPISKPNPSVKIKFT